MRIALDATYSLDEQPSGIAVYSRELIDGVSALHPEHEYLRCYRWKQWRSAGGHGLGSRLLLPPLPTFRADLFHALNQRVDARPAKRVASTFHDLFVFTGDYSSPDFRKRFMRQAREAAHRSDHIIAVSEFTARQVQSILNVKSDRITVVPHGVRLPAHDPTPLARRPKLVLFVGALQKRKNVGRLVEAFRAAPDEWQLVLAGATTGYGVADILAGIETSPVRERIQVSGYLSAAELTKLYGRASIFAFPSLDEGFGMPVLEAMAHGVPVLTSSGSALAEVSGGAALLVDPHRAEAISDGLLRLMAGIDERERLRLAGLRRAEDFSWERACAATCAVYAKLLR